MHEWSIAEALPGTAAYEAMYTLYGGWTERGRAHRSRCSSAVPGRRVQYTMHHNMLRAAQLPKAQSRPWGRLTYVSDLWVPAVARKVRLRAFRRKQHFVPAIVTIWLI
jgi:hypothetical protein